MADKEKNKDQRDLESGDNPEERDRTSEKLKKDQGDQASGPKDLESGDNPDERERTSGK